MILEITLKKQDMEKQFLYVSCTMHFKNYTILKFRLDFHLKKYYS